MNPRDMFRLRGTGWYRYDFGARRWSKRWSLSSLAVLFAEVPQPASYLTGRMKPSVEYGR